ncbi:hypothetical protein IE53DRAFT_364051 [Violaceomyces palustris]|uniref:Uncharacterized protein n=1 Tax=Violaceomyces palustris TaxID=1673888 RepID=A0ACD0NR26_9BASI|nr:hypothetical protein IE53DRAFT_364051 [Violaceomyces palustris]
MDPLDTSAEGGAPSSPSPSPTKPVPLPVTPSHHSSQNQAMSSSRSFKPPPRPGSSLRKPRKSHVADDPPSPPPPLPSFAPISPTALTDTTNLDNDNHHPHRFSFERPSSSSSSSQPTDPAAQTVALTRQLRQRLEQLSEDNQSQVNSAGLLGQGLLEIRQRLESLYDELQDELQRIEQDQNDSASEGHHATEMRTATARIHELNDRIDAEVDDMELKKQRLYSELGIHSAEADQTLRSIGDASPSKAARVASVIKNLTGHTPSRQAAPTPRQGDRRSRNAAARQAKADSELVNEIQAGLVQEVRRLQGLLAERDQQRIAVLASKDEMEKQLNIWKPKALLAAESEDKLKAENWDLNYAKQNLEEQLADLTASLKKADSEKAKLTRDLGKSREAVDSQRLQIDNLTTEIERLKQLRETDVALGRKNQAGMQREISDLQGRLTLAEKANAKDSNMSRSVSNSGILTDDSVRQLEDDDEERKRGMHAARLRSALGQGVAPPASPGDSVYSDDARASPLGARLVRDKEIQDLRSKLVVAQKKAGKDSAERRRLREQNSELKRLLLAAGGRAPADLDVESSEDEAGGLGHHGDDDDDDGHWIDEPGQSPAAKRSATMGIPKSSTRPSIANRLGIKGSTTEESSDFDDSFGDEDSVVAPQPLPTEADAKSAANSGSLTVGPEEAEDLSGTMETADHSGASRPSLDGMDPAFADVMRPAFGTAGKSLQRGLAGHHAPSSPLARNSMLADSSEGEMDSPPRQRSAGRLTSRKSAAALRPSSEVFEPSALVNELAGLDEPAAAAAAAAGDHAHDEPEALGDELDRAIQAGAPPKETAELGVMTEPLEDLVTPALAEQGRHHELVITELESKHAQLLAQKAAAHEEALATARASHERTLALASDEHESALHSRDALHAAALAATIAERAKAHEAALAQARSRHSRTLEEQVAASSSALAEAESKHQALLQEQAAKHKSELDRRDAAHAGAIADMERQHRDMVADIEATNATFEAQRDSAFKKAIAAREEALQRSEAEIERLSKALKELEARLEAARREHSDSNHARDASEKELLETRNALVLAQERVKEREAAAAASADVESDDNQQAAVVTDTENEADDFEDAVSHMVVAAPRVRHAKPSAAIESDTGSEAGAMPGTPGDATTSQDEAGIRKVILADLRESACQTDDLLWSRFQHSQAEPRPLSSMTNTSNRTADGFLGVGDFAVGQGGVMVLGGHRSQRPRDSVSTFGGNREGSFRVESPAPTMYTVGAVTGHHHQQQNQQVASRRPSMESTWSQLTDRQGNEIPPVPPLPDRSKPPSMAVPPPPSMPPPATIPTKTRAATNVATAYPPPPPRPTSPPPPDLLTRATAQRSSHLQVPPSKGSGGEQPRSVSRASTRTAPAPLTRPSNNRSRTMSSETSGSLPQTPIESSKGYAASVNGVGRQSITSKRSVAAYRRGPRQSSAASFVSDVTSELSRRFSLASSRNSDDDGDAGDRTFVARDRNRGVSEFGASDGTDPSVIQSITQTMIGEYMYKYTRRSMGRGGHSDRRHRRYFWVHPYTKMLYWTISDPGGAKVHEGTSKSASIEQVKVVEDLNVNPPGLYHLSIVIQTASREVKITAPSRERHEAWVSALGYLVSRPQIHDAAAIAAENDSNVNDGENAGTMTAAAAAAAMPRSSARQRSKTANGTVKSPSTTRRPSPPRSLRTRKSVDRVAYAAAQYESTPRQRGGSIGAHSGALYPSASSKRRDLAAREWLQQHERESNLSPTPSVRRGSMTPSRRNATGSGQGEAFASGLEAEDSYDGLVEIGDRLASDDPRLKTAEEMLEEDEQESGFEGLDNVRACCDGKHDVGSLAHNHHHHHHQSSHSSKRTLSRATTSKRNGGRQSSSRFSSIGLKSPKLDGEANQVWSDREATGGGGGGGGGSTSSSRAISPQPPQIMPLNLPRESLDSVTDMFGKQGSDGVGGVGHDNVFGGGGGRIQNRSASQPGQQRVPPATGSFGERIQKIKQARQSAGPRV